MGRMSLVGHLPGLIQVHMGALNHNRLLSRFLLFRRARILFALNQHRAVG